MHGSQNMGCLLASRLEEDEIVWAYRNIRRGPCISNNVTTDLFMTILEENMEYIEKLIGQARSWYLEKKSNRDLDNFTANAGNKNYTCFPRDYKLHTGQNVLLRRDFFYAESEEHIW